MQNKSYGRRRLPSNSAVISTIALILAVCALCVGGAVASGRISFSQVSGKVAGPQIRDGVVDYSHLTYPLRHQLDVLRDDAASNAALNAQPRQWGEDIARALAALEARIAAEYVHK